MIFLDLIKTGYNPNIHGIVEIAGADSCEKKEFHANVRVERDILVHKKVLREYGIEEYEIYNPSRESLERALKEFRDWSKGLKNIVLAGHNTHLDIKFLKRSMERYGLEWDFGYRAVDLFSIAIGILKNQGEKIPEINGLFDLNFDDILERVGLKKRKKPYDALENARLKAEAFNRLVYGKSLFEEFQG